MDSAGLIGIMKSMQIRRGWVARQAHWLAITGLFGVAPAMAANDYQNSPQVAEFISEMTRDYGFANERLSELFNTVERKQSILDAISRPAERVRQWKDYRPIFITEARISKGLAFWAQHAEALAQAEREYGVPAEIIVAIIGVETSYGGNTGNYRVIDALSTLAFDFPPRAPFFRKELREFLLLAREEQVDPSSLKGSYAGAMGLPQFMPSSFRAYAVDFDGDGHINIWSNPSDAIGSVASYFKRHDWHPGEPIVSRARVQGDQVDQGLSVGLEPDKQVGQLRALGWSSEAILRDDQVVTGLRLEGSEGMEYWMALPNFFAITRYNHSAMYAMAVNQLSELLVQARGSNR
jgi:membrane-bound lytic murein transglycosylase B